MQGLYYPEIICHDPAMKTTFLRWLERHSLTASAFQSRTGLSLASVYTLAGIGFAKPVKRLDPALCRRVSAETGIPWDRLLREAEAARENPVPPRKYERRAPDAAAE
jgi:hypothetical protein